MRALRTMMGVAVLLAGGGGARAAAADAPFRVLAPLRADPGRGDAASFAPGAGARFPEGAPGFTLIAGPRRPLPRAGVPRPGTRRARLLLPVFVQMGFESWSLAGGRGHSVYPGLAGRDSWRSSGFVAIRTLSPRLSLGAEFSHEPDDLLDGHANSALAAGARYRLAGPLSLTLAGGPYLEHHGGTGIRATTGLGIAF